MAYKVQNPNYKLHIKIWFKIKDNHKIDIDDIKDKKEVVGITNLYRWYEKSIMDQQKERRTIGMPKSFTIKN